MTALDPRPIPLPSGQTARLQIVGAASALGAPHPGTAQGPAALRDALIERLRAHNPSARWMDTLQADTAPPPADAAMPVRLAAVGEFACQLAERIAALDAGAFPFVVGGDHAVAIGTWRGIARRLGGAPGLIWVDAHLDSHTDATTHSGNIHGMPLAALLGEGAPALADVPGPRLDPARVCVIGARDWENEEHERLARLGVRIFDMTEIHRRGLAAIFADALEIVRGEHGFGVSIDLDALDPLALPAVTCPAADGIEPRALADALLMLRGRDDFIALEIVEYRPDLDPHGHDAAWVAELAIAALGPATCALRARERHFGARNYAPLPVVFHRGEGVWLWDVEGRRYLDMMSAYSAVSFGHAHPRLLRALEEQARRLALTSRAYSNDRLPPLLERLCALFGYERALPMNTGAEAVETALKAARKWAHKIKGVPADRAEIIACEGNFHGRTIAIVGLSSEPAYRDGFGPFPPGLLRVPYGDADALEAAITPRTAAFLVEPIQGEGGIVLPPPGYLARCADICRRHDVLLIADEVQTGLGRTGRLLACEHDGIRPDGVILGKALGGGLLPVSAFLADERVMQVFTPGDHGSTFGGNPLAAAVAWAALDVLEDEGLVERAATLGSRWLARLARLRSPRIREVRGRGLFIGIELADGPPSAATAAEWLLARGLLTKDTHQRVLRLAPPLIVEEKELDWAADVLEELFAKETPTTTDGVLETAVPR